MRYWFILLFLISGICCLAQDSVVQDSMQQVLQSAVADSNPPATVVHTPKTLGTKRATTGSPFFIAGLFCLLIVGLLRFFYGRYLNELLEVVTKSTLSHLISRDSLWQKKLQRYLFMLIYYLSAGYIVGQLIMYFTKLPAGSVTYWSWGVACVLGIAVLKRLAVHAVALVFRLNRQAATFFDHISVFSQLTGFILLLICGIALILPPFAAQFMVIIGAIIWLISLIIKGLVNVAYVKNLPGVHFLHFILYLCTLEFIPLAVCARYVYNGIGA